jgi:DNA-binding IclR family transcriptional regulator
MVLEKAFAIQEIMVEYPEGIALGPLTALAKMNKSTLYRILQTLQSLGYVVKKRNGTYCLGYKYFFLAQAIFDAQLKNIALPYMRKLSEETGEIVHLSVEENGEMVFVEEIDPNTSSSITIRSLLGKRGNLHSTSAGKAYLSTLPPGEVEAILSRKGMPSYTKRTITSIPKFLKEMEEVRKIGFAVDDMENSNDVRCTAAPIVDIQGEVIGVLDITVTTFSASLDRLFNLGVAVKECSAAISGQIGLSTAMRRVM